MNRTIALTVLAITAGTATAGINVVNNGDFETGDYTGWETLPSGNSFFGMDTATPYAGNFSANFDNQASGSAALIKQSGMGAGLINAGDEITISFWAKDLNGPGGVNFCEFFSINDAGGVTGGGILGGAPLFAGADWTFFSFTTNAAADVSGGVTIQFTASTGAFDGSTSEFFLDDVMVTVVPAPTSVALLGLGGLVATRRRR